MNILAYLERIGYSGSLEPDLETLQALHQAHLSTVPFENLDIHAGRPIVLDPAAFYRKVVEEWRGGFCYELNGLFSHLLRELGYQVTLISARVARPDGGFGPEFDHLALLVNLDEPYLVDVGFGNGFIEPLRLKREIEQFQAGRAFRLTTEGEEWTVWRKEKDGEWKANYAFNLMPRCLSDFAGMCEYHQTSPLSSFPKAPVISLLRPGGRVTLAAMKLIVTEDGDRYEEDIRHLPDYTATLKELFAIELPPPLEQNLLSKLK